MKNRPHYSILSFAIVLSCCLHLAFYFFSDQLGAWFPREKSAVFLTENKPPPPIEVDVVDPQARLVPQTELPPELLRLMEDVKEMAHLLSEKSQRVKKEQRASLFGLSKNRFKDTSKNQPPSSKPEPQSEDDRKQADARGAETNSRKHANVMPSPEIGISSFQQEIPNIQAGSITALNSDRHIFGSFYNRVNEAIAYPWYHEIGRILENLDKRLMDLNPNAWTTRVDILLKPNGEFYKAVLLKESGIVEFDAASTKFFKLAKIFPNPPKEMVGEDGLIRLKYEFQVYTRTQ